MILALGFVLLAVFKFKGFVLGDVEAATGWASGIQADWMLLLGIPFVTFTALAYIIDVRVERVPAEPRFFHTVLFISFFPHLIAGLILRARELIPQITRIRVDRQAVFLAFFVRHWCRYP